MVWIIELTGYDIIGYVRLEKRSEYMEQKDQNPLVREAQNLGAEIVPDEQVESEPGQGPVETDTFQRTKGIKDALGDGKIDFHSDMPKTEFKELVGAQFLIKQVRIVKDWDSIFGASDFALLFIELGDGSSHTTLAGGRAVMRQCRKLLDGRLLPVRVKLTMREGAQGQYYIFE